MPQTDVDARVIFNNSQCFWNIVNGGGDDFNQSIELG